MSTFETGLTSDLSVSRLGKANGFAPLDETSKVPSIFLPDAVSGNATDNFMRVGNLFSTSDNLQTFTFEVPFSSADGTTNDDIIVVLNREIQNASIYLAAVQPTLTGFSVNRDDSIDGVGTSEPFTYIAVNKNSIPTTLVIPGEGASSAIQVSYDNAVTNLTAVNVQEAIDEISTVLPSSVTFITNSTYVIYIDNVNGDDASTTPSNNLTPLKTFEAAAVFVKNRLLFGPSSNLNFNLLSNYNYQEEKAVFDGSFVNGILNRITLFGNGFTIAASSSLNNLILQNFREKFIINTVDITGSVTFLNCSDIEFENTNNLQNVNVQSCNQFNVQEGTTFTGRGTYYNSNSVVLEGSTNNDSNFYNISTLQLSGNIVDNNPASTGSNTDISIYSCGIANLTGLTFGPGVLDGGGVGVIQIENTQVSLSGTWVFQGSTLRRSILHATNCKVEGFCLFRTDTQTSPISMVAGFNVLKFINCVLGEDVGSNFNIIKSNSSPATPVFTSSSSIRSFIELDGGSIQYTGENDTYISAELFGGAGLPSKFDLFSARLGSDFDNQDSGLSSTNKSDAINELNNIKVNNLVINGLNPETSFSTTANHLDFILANVTSNAITITPPSNPAVGFRFRVADSRGNAFSNNITVDFVGSSQLFHSNSTNYIIDQDNGSIEFYYINSTIGWISL